MLLANIYLLCWDYERLKYILPFKRSDLGIPKQKVLSNKFPFKFFGGVIVTAAAVVVINIFIFEIRPGNSEIECRNGINSKHPKASSAFCDCIYDKGKPLDSCLKEFNEVKEREMKDRINTRADK
jgi:hypothetical protein